ncbi:hypothetical protein BC332_25806 [Capsicum chinense]|nr:hypothetical protein BC332_25806 [Capsicum chinense]
MHRKRSSVGKLCYAPMMAPSLYLSRALPHSFAVLNSISFLLCLRELLIRRHTGRPRLERIELYYCCRCRCCLPMTLRLLLWSKRCHFFHHENCSLCPGQGDSICLVGFFACLFHFLIILYFTNSY